ncbi:MAG: alpha/beta hydrolase [Ilumatobacteraceae bacterium]
MLPVPRRSRRRPFATVLLAGAVLGPAVASATAPVGHHGADVPELAWTDCGDGLQCSTASVPLDHDRPRGEHISLSLARLPATDQAHRIGTLFVNNGGPGNSVIEFMHGDVHDVVPAAVQARFDIVGFDPRGVGESTPVRCFDDTDAQQTFFGELPPFPVTPDEVTEATTAARRLGRACARRNGDLLDHVGTADVARDLDLLRRAVGDDQLTFAGYSYGGLIGLTYAQLYPGRVRATVLDGAPDPVAWTTGTAADRKEPFSVRVDSHEAARDALGYFLESCQQAGVQGCAFAADDTRAKFDGLMDQLRDGAIVVDLPPGPAGPGGPTPITYAFVVDSLRGALQFPPIWGDVAGLLQVVADGAATEAVPPALAPPDEAPVDEAAAGAEPEPPAVEADEYDNSREALLAVSCSETRNPSDPRRWVTAAERADQDAPYFGADFTWLSLPCATWAGQERDRVVGRFDAVTANPMLFVNSRFDAASPLDGAAAVAARTPGAALLTVEGAGHPASFLPNECLATAVSTYLIDQVVPAPGATCPAGFEPFTS